MMGFVSFFENFLTIAILLIAWLFVIIAFFLLAIQLFITIIEFKLTALAGFVLVPFALWNRTSFLAERVLGNVVSSGIKVMVLAVIVGIGSGFFAEFAGAAGGDTDLVQAMSLVLASLTLVGLGIFGPGIATGLAAGAPQLGAGAAVGTMALGAGSMIVGGGAALAGARGAASGGLAALRAGTSMGSAASTAYRLGQETGGSNKVGAGVRGMASAAAHGIRDRASAGAGLSAAAERGERAALFAGSNRSASASSTPAPGAGDETPQWARRLRSDQAARHHRHLAVQALREGDRGGSGANPDISEGKD
jgi:type IV secretion system protein TrbL